MDELGWFLLRVSSLAFAAGLVVMPVFILKIALGTVLGIILGVVMLR